MAIDRIPGVGPQNTDIASAVAASSAVSSMVTAAVPTASAIATAVAAPSAATIASTVAASVPTLSQINTAVNTQTNNSAIATAVAAAVPTLSQINTSVSTYAPSANNWTYITSATVSASTSLSFSGLSGYKKYRILGYGTHAVAGWPWMLRLNGTGTTDTCVVYGYGTIQSNGLVQSFSTSTSNFRFTGDNQNIGSTGIMLDIDNATHTSGVKRISGIYNYVSTGSRTTVFEGYSTTAAAVTSINFLDINGSQTFTGTYYLYGAN